jgi:hypothetical protein
MKIRIVVLIRLSAEFRAYCRHSSSDISLSVLY